MKNTDGTFGKHSKLSLRRASRSRFTPYLMALAATALAIGLRAALTPLLGQSTFAYITLFPVVVLLAAYYGLGPSLLSLTAGACASFYVILGTAFGEGGAQLRRQLLAGLVVYLLTGLASALLGNAAYRARREATQRAAIIESSADAIYSYDFNGRVLSWNRGAERLYGWTAAEMIGRKVSALMPPDGADETLGQIIPAIRRGESVINLETMRQRRGGDCFNALLTASPVRDRAGRAEAISVIVRDVTERKRTEAFLRESEERLRLASEAAEFGVYERRFDPDELEWSPAIKRIFGLPPDAPVSAGEPLRRIHPDDLERVAAEIRAGFDPAGTGDFESEHRIVRPDGAVRWIRVKGRTEFQKGRPRRARGALLDITARKQAEEELRQSTALLQTVLESTPDLVWAKDLEGRITLGNQATFNLLGGGEASKVLGLGAIELIPHPEHARRVMENDARVMAVGRAEAVEEPFGDPAQPLIFQTIKAPLRDGAGRVVGVVGVSRDVTADKQAEEKLRKSEAEYRSLFETAGLGNAEVELDTGRFLRVNHKYCELTGYTADELLGLTFLEITHPDDRERNREAITPHLREEDSGVFEIEKRYVRKDGSIVWVHLTGTLIRDAGGRALRLLGSAHDISARKQAEDELRYQLQLVRNITDAAAVAIFVADDKGDIEFINPEAERLFGYRLDELRDRSLHEIIHYQHPDGRPFPIAECPLGSVFETGVPVRDFETVFYRKDGAPVFALVSSMPVLENGRSVGEVMAIHDISARRLQELNQQLLLKLGELIRAVGDAGELQARAADLLGPHLQATRCLFNEIDWSNARAIVRHEYRCAGASSFLGAVSLEKYSPVTGAELADGRTVVVHDAQNDTRTAPHYAAAYGPNGIGAYIAVPLIRDGCWIGTLWVDRGAPQVWQDWEVELVQTVGERIWLAAEKLRGEQRMRAWEERFRLASDAGAALVYDVDLTGSRNVVVYGLERVTGYVVDEQPLTSEWWHALIHPADLPAHMENLERQLTGAEAYRTTYRIRHKTGAWIWVEDTAQTLRDETGAAVQLVGAIVDVTARKQYEEKLRENEARLRMALDASFTIAFTWDIQCDVVRRYHSADPVLGRTDETHTDTFENIVSHIYPEDRDGFRRNVQAALKSPIGLYQSEYRIAHPNGEIRWYAERGQVEFAPDGAPMQLIGLSMDITERKQLELGREQLLVREQHARQLAEEANRAKDDWLAMVTHELRSPLNAILGHARLLTMQRARLSPELADFADLVRRNGERQNELINDLLDTARMMTGKLRLELGAVNPAAIIADALDVVRPSALAKGVRLHSDVNINIGAMTGDAMRLQQVVWNLLTNAVKFTEIGGSVSLSLRREEEHLVLAVSDTGQGIAPDFLPHVFERFSQADSSRSRRFGGLGLGLALAKQIVELHGGHIRAASAGTGQGATFTVTLPLQTALPAQPQSEEAGSRFDSRMEEALETAASSVSTLPHSTRSPFLYGVQVLIVEDEADAREIVEVLLKMEGAETLTAADAADAWPLLTAAARPDALLCDIGLPSEDGHQLMRRLRRWEHQQAMTPLPAVALTAHNGVNDRLQSLTAGFQMHVTKPIDPDELLLVLAGVLKRATDLKVAPDVI